MSMEVDLEDQPDAMAILPGLPSLYDGLVITLEDLSGSGTTFILD